MKILSLDLGKKSAYYVGSSGSGMGSEFTITSQQGLYDLLESLVLAHLPDVILYPKPVRFYNTIFKHGQYVGEIKHVAEKYKIKLVEVIDSQCKKAVIGNGKATKEEIMAFFKEENEHVADCRMFEQYYLSCL